MIGIAIGIFMGVPTSEQQDALASLAWQALLGQPLLAPDGLPLTVLAGLVLDNVIGVA